MELDPEQRDAVSCNAKKVVILAGAGSGKTATIVYRFLHFLKMGYSAKSILPISFTDKAAMELRSRINSAITLENMEIKLDDIGGYTYHSLAYQLIREKPDFYGMPKNWNIVSNFQKRSFWENACSKAQVHFPAQSHVTTEFVTQFWDEMINAGYSVSDTTKIPEPKKFYADARRYYLQSMEKHSVIDYDTMLYRLMSRIEKYPDYAAELRKRFPVVLVDEFQDNNLVQERILRGINPDYLTLVGDCSQAIYGFRGAEQSLILKYQDDPEVVVKKLTTNYRSAAPIIEVANQLVLGDKGAIQMMGQGVNGSVDIVSAKNQKDEAMQCVEWVVKEIKSCKVAILARTNHDLKFVCDELSARGVPFTFTQKKEKPSHPAINIAQGIVDLFVNNDKDAKMLLAKFPKHKIDGTIDFLRSTDSYKQSLNHIRTTAFDVVTDKSGALVALDHWFSKAIHYGSLANLSNDLLPDNDDAPIKSPSHPVVVTTIHTSKGLEWDKVWIIGAGNNQIPHPRFRDARIPAHAYQEEKRLAYVATTRAKRKCIVSYPQNFRDSSQEISEFFSKPFPLSH